MGHPDSCGWAGLLGSLALAGHLLGAVPVAAQTPLDTLRRGMEAERAFTQGKTAYDQRSYSRARERFARAVVLDPAHDEARALLGWSEYFVGDYRGAIVTFKSAIERQPDWDGLYDGLGWSRLRLGRHHLASEAFQQALDRNPRSVDALIGLGTAQFELGHYESALPPLRSAVSSGRTLVGRETAELAEARARIGWCLLYLGRPAEALTAFEAAIRTTPDWHGLHSGAGWSLLRLGRLAEARAAFERALRLKPGYPDAAEGLRQAGG